MVTLVAFYGWLALQTTRHALLKTQAFGFPDVLCSSILSLWMIMVIWHSMGSQQEITLQAIFANSIVYISLVLGIFGVMGFRGLPAIATFQLQPSRFPGRRSRDSSGS